MLNIQEEMSPNKSKNSSSSLLLSTNPTAPSETDENSSNDDEDQCSRMSTSDANDEPPKISLSNECMEGENRGNGFETMF
jgi:hypothetical protein